MKPSVLWHLFFILLTGAQIAAEDEMPWSEGTIPIRFKLDKPAFVTLVIDDNAGKRVRNLLAEEQFAAGEHVIFWDCADGPDVHLHKSNGALVNPGKYVIRGLVRDELKLIYEFAVYNPGNPPWGVRDNQTGLYFGRWLSDHNPPSGALFLPDGSPAGKQPQLMFCAGASEWGDGFMWTDLDGRKLHGQRWAGGVFSGAERLACDMGSRGVPGVYAYSIKGIRTKPKKDSTAKDQFAFRVMAFQEHKKAAGQAPFGEVQVLGQDRPLAGKNNLAPGASPVRGLAAWNGLVIVSATCDDQLIIIDAKRNHVPKPEGPQQGGSIGEEIGSVPLDQTRGLAFNAAGDLFVVADAKLLAFPEAGKTLPDRQLPKPRVLVEKGLEDPSDVTLDKAGNLYVSDRGTSHQVKVYAPDGKFLRAIGKPGGVRLGPYDEQRMFNPAQVAITDAAEVWVAESQFTPRRISRWKTDGTFVCAYYGPPGYGGGGQVTPDGKRVIYCHSDPWHAQATIEFAVDWKSGTSRVQELSHWIDVPGSGALRVPGNGGPTHRFEYHGRHYAHNGSQEQVTWWLQRDERWIPAASMTRPKEWKEAIGSDPFKGRVPEGVDLNARYDDGPWFAWADLNGDGAPQPDEFKWANPTTDRRKSSNKLGAFSVSDGFTVFTSRGRVYRPTGFTEQGAPIFDLNLFETFAPDPGSPQGDGGLAGTIQLCRDGSVLQLGSPITLWRDGKRQWTYPNEWFGVHGSHAAPPPRWGGDINGGTKAPGPLFTPRSGEAGQLWALCANYGCVHLGTTDGLYVGTVMRDARRAGGWPADIKRGDNVIQYTGGQESFGISLQPLDDGRIVMSVGGEMIGLCRLEGLESVRRLPDKTITVSAADLAAAFAMHRQKVAKLKPKDDILTVSMDGLRRAVTANLDDWKNADWVTVETLPVVVGMGTKPMEMKAAIQVHGDRLHAAWLVRSSESFVANSLESPSMLFKTGAALDLMLGPVGADPARKTPVAGDLRLLVARTPGPKGVFTAMLYRQKFDNAGNKQTFSSPWRSVQFDDVRNVSSVVEFKESQPIKAMPTNQRLYEVAIPLSQLGLQVKDGSTITGDIGYLRGTVGQTSERIYWHNKVTGLIADVPGEVMLEPAQWGTLKFSFMK